MKEKIYGTNVLVTGASSGIGKATASIFAENGYTVYAISRHIEEKEYTLGKGKIIQLQADVTDRVTLEELKKRIDNLSIIIHAAGFGIAGSAEDVSAEEAERQIKVNYLGPVLVDNIFLPLLRQRRRSLVIFISSIAGRIPIPFQSHYSSSKYALEAYAECLGMEGKPFGIHTVLLEPGDTKTDFTRSRKKIIPENSSYKRAAEKAISRMEADERNGKSPETVAKAALKAASSSHPPVRKPIGLGYSLLMLLPRILPQKIIEKILIKLY